jgi:MFS family permease
MSEIIQSETESLQNPRHFSVFGRRRGKFFMKLFYYEGLMLFLPYIILTYLSQLDFESSIPQSNFIIVMMAISLSGLFIMDFIGFQSRILDRYSRFITLSFAIVGLLGSILILLFSFNGFNIYNWGIAFGTVLVFIAFQGFGWYFIRADRGIVAKKKERPYFQSTVYAIGLSSFGFLMEFFIPQGLIIGILISFAAFLAIMRYELVEVTPKLKVRHIIKPFRRVTAWNFFIDMVKLGAIILTVLALSYNSNYVLFPTGPNILPNQWVLNLFVVGLSATVAMYVYNKIKLRFYGLLVIVVVFFITIGMTAIIWIYPAVHWAIIAALNGWTIAGLYYFIEQKMDLSSNVRAMPGSFYILVFIIFSLAIAFRTEPNLARYLTNLGPIVSLLGIAYIYGYLQGIPQNSLKVSWGSKFNGISSDTKE